MVRRLIYTLLLVVSCQFAYGQFQIGVTGNFVPTVASNLGKESSISGGGIGVVINYDLIYPLGISSDVTMNITHFGTDVMFGWSFFNLHNLNSQGTTKFGAKVRLGTGMGLYRPRPLFEVQLGAGVMFHQSLGERCIFQTDFGFRYDWMVDYNQYSGISAYWNLPLTVSFVWRLGKVEPKDLKLGGDHYGG